MSESTPIVSLVSDTADTTPLVGLFSKSVRKSACLTMQLFLTGWVGMLLLRQEERMLTLMRMKVLKTQ